MSEFYGLKGQEVEFYYTGFNSGSINFAVRYPVIASNAIKGSYARSRGIVAVKKAYDKANITIPFRTGTLYFDNTLQAKVGQSAPGIYTYGHSRRRIFLW